MKDTTLLTFSTIVGLIGIISLYIIMQFSDINEYSIIEIHNTSDGKTVKISGIVQKVTSNGKATFVDINQTCSITGIIFDNVSIKKGEKVQIIGKVSEYNGNKEILIDEIKLKYYFFFKKIVLKQY